MLLLLLYACSLVAILFYMGPRPSLAQDHFLRISFDVGDGGVPSLHVEFYLILGCRAMCCVVKVKMNLNFGTMECINTIPSVGVDISTLTVKIYYSVFTCSQPIFIVMHRAVIQSYFCVSITTVNPDRTICRKITPGGNDSSTSTHKHSITTTPFYILGACTITCRIPFSFDKSKFLADHWLSNFVDFWNSFYK